MLADGGTTLAETTSQGQVTHQRLLFLGRGGGQVVSVLAIYSNDLSSNPAEAYSFFL